MAGSAAREPFHDYADSLNADMMVGGQGCVGGMAAGVGDGHASPSTTMETQQSIPT